MNNNFCPLINDYCKSNCVFIEEMPGYLQTVKKCSLAESVKISSDKPNFEVLAELKRLLSKI